MYHKMEAIPENVDNSRLLLITPQGKDIHFCVIMRLSLRRLIFVVTLHSHFVYETRCFWKL